MSYANYDFRKTKWGMSRDEVKSTEDATFDLESENFLFYEGHVAYMNCRISYRFLNNMLVSAAYHFTEEHSNKNDYLYDYFKLKDILKKKYEDPAIDDIDWRNRLYVDSEEDYGFAISLGHLQLFAAWDTPSTDISCNLKGDNQEVELGVLYRSKAHQHLVEESLESKELDDF